MRLAFCLMAVPLWASGTFTSVQSGNWNDPTTWGFAAGAPVCHTNIPCMTDAGDAGDKVLLGNLAHTVTCPTGVTCSAGTSPTTNDQSNPAIGAVSYANSTAVLVVASGATLVYAGAVLHNNSTWVFEAGSTIIHDTSWAATPSAYTWSLHHTASGNGGRNHYQGTAGSHVTWNGAGNSAANPACANNACRSGQIGNNGTDNYADNGTTTCSYTDFQHVGLSSFGGIGFSVRITAADSSFDHCTFDNSAALAIYEIAGGTANLTITGLKITNSVISGNPPGSLFVSPANSTGTRTISNSHIYGLVNMSGARSQIQWRDVLFEQGPSGIGFYVGASSTLGGFDTSRVMVHLQSTSDIASQLPPGTHSNWVFSRYNNSGQSNMHPLYAMIAGGITLRDWYTEGSIIGNRSSDFIQLRVPGTGSTGALIEGSILPCQPDGQPYGSFVNASAPMSSDAKIRVINNTYCSAPGDVTMGVGWEGGNQDAGSWQQVTSNLVYRLDAAGNVWTICGPDSLSVGAFGTVGYNATYYDNGSASYCAAVLVSGKVATGPSNDLRYNRVPNLLDAQRRMLMFDIGYLGESPASAWQTGQAYAVGTVVSDSQASVHAGATINWRLISADGGCATSGSTNRPLTGTSWIGCWEPATLQHVRDALASGATYTDASLGITDTSVIGALNAWTRRGQRPEGADATILRHTGYGGTHIGAVAPAAVPVMCGMPNGLICR